MPRSAEDGLLPWDKLQKVSTLHLIVGSWSSEVFAMEWQASFHHRRDLHEKPPDSHEMASLEMRVEQRREASCSDCGPALDSSRMRDQGCGQGRKVVIDHLFVLFLGAVVWAASASMAVGQQWEAIDSGLPEFILGYVGLASDETALYAALFASGVYRSTDGVDWTRTKAPGSVRSLEAFRDIVLVASLSSPYLHYSFDSGLSWQGLEKAPERGVHLDGSLFNITSFEDDSGTLVAHNSFHPFLSSNDRGRTWRSELIGYREGRYRNEELVNRLLPRLASSRTKSFNDFLNLDDRDLVATSQGLFSTLDSGGSWTLLPLGDSLAYSVQQDNLGRLYVATRETADGSLRLHVSSDLGLTWADLPVPEAFVGITDVQSVHLEVYDDRLYLASRAMLFRMTLEELPEPPTGLWTFANGAAPQGWKSSWWFGLFYADRWDVLWIYHREHGWLAGVGSNDSSIWLWSTSLGWTWTNRVAYPHFLRWSDRTWLLYELGTRSPRRFLNLETELWEELD